MNSGKRGDKVVKNKVIHAVEERSEELLGG
jgi:hypothetical protein